MDKCPQCGGKVWDNTEENKKRIANGQKPRPEYSCKDKEGCGWVKWAERPKKTFVKPIIKDNPDIEILKLACVVANDQIKTTAEKMTMSDMTATITRFYHDLKNILNPISKQEPQEPEVDVDWNE